MVRRWRTVTAVLFVLATTAVVEWLNGRTFFCRCGRIRLWTGTVRGPENSQQIADWYSPSHFIHGLLLYGATRLVLPGMRIGQRIVAAAVIEAVWEGFENSAFIIDRYRAVTVSWGYSGDSILNSLSDILFMLLGFVIASRIPVWASIAIAVALELLTLAVIRDNLTLNVLMLVYPLAGIRAWQAG